MEWLKTIHVSSVALSFFGFFLRGIWMLVDSQMLQKKWVKILPHFIDAILLISATGLLYVLQWSIFDKNWLLTKIAVLFIYIGLGMLALKPGRPKAIRGSAWGAALLVYIYMVSVALTKSSYGFIEWLL